MKVKFYLFFLMMIFNVSFSRAQQKIEELEKKKGKFQKMVSLYNDSIKLIDSDILVLKSEKIKSIIADSSLTSFVLKGAKLKSSPSYNGKELDILKDDEKVVIVDYSNGYFGVCAKGICGYMSEVWIKRDERINDFVTLKKKELEDLEALQRERAMKQNQREYASLENKYITKYGKAIYSRLKEGYVWIGMTKEMATISQGQPNNINRTVGSWGVHEQWVYSSLYLYFENGKVTSYQD